MKKYAEWLADDLGCEILETKSARLADIEKYDVIILGGGIYASGIAGLSFIKKNYPKLKDKKLPYSQFVLHPMMKKQCWR